MRDKSEIEARYEERTGLGMTAGREELARLQAILDEHYMLPLLERIVEASTQELGPEEIDAWAARLAADLAQEPSDGTHVSRQEPT